MDEAILLGDINIDVLMPVPAYPDPGGDVSASEVALRAGGTVANTAAVLAGLGVTTRLVGSTGDDPWADLALAGLHEHGVDIRGVRREPRAATGLIFIPVLPGGERTMFSFRGANVLTDPEHIKPEMIARARLLHLSGYNFLHSPQREASWWAVEHAVRAGAALSLDVGLIPASQARRDLHRLMPLLSICILGMEEAGALLDVDTPAGVIDTLLERGVGMVGLKVGASGCWLATPQETVELPRFPVTPVDSTGAGDAFGAGLLFAWFRGLTLPAAGVLANALGALATTVLGGGPALPDRRMTLKFLRQQSRAPVPGMASAWLREAMEALGAVA